MKPMRLLFLFAALNCVAANASITVPLKPPQPGLPTESYATFAERCRAVDLVVFEFRGDRKIFMRDPAWLDAFKTALASSEGKPDAPCFCISEPAIKLYSKDRLLCSFELPHDNKVRFSGSDFIVPAETQQTLTKLIAIAMKNERYAPPTKSRQHNAPARVELKP